MAISETVYSPSYPNNTKTVTIDIVSRIPTGAGGDEKYILYVYTTAYSNNTSRTSINPIYMYDLKRGWAQSYDLSSPITTAGGTLTIAIDEQDANAITVTVTSGTYTGPLLADHIQEQIRTVASGVKTGSALLAYSASEVFFEDSKITILAGSTKGEYNTSDWSKVTSVKVTGGTASIELGFSTGYPNSYDMAATTSGRLYSPASAHATVDDAIRWAVMAISEQIDYTS